jgi:IMP dehydrogenase
VGISGGSCCSTKIQTGHGVPLLETVFNCKLMKEQEGLSTAIIADGGIKNSGDIVKALAAGADAIMCGSLLSGTDEAPGNVVNGRKTYQGMASSESQQAWRGKSSAPEGISTTVKHKGSVHEILKNLHRWIQSGFSYSGAMNLKELQESAIFLEQTAAGQFESSTHILARTDGVGVVTVEDGQRDDVRVGDQAFFGATPRY